MPLQECRHHFFPHRFPFAAGLGAAGFSVPAALTQPANTSTPTPSAAASFTAERSVGSWHDRDNNVRDGLHLHFSADASSGPKQQSATDRGRAAPKASPKNKPSVAPIKTPP